jgi:hypothetical protein
MKVAITLCVMSGLTLDLQLWLDGRDAINDGNPFQLTDAASPFRSSRGA